MSGRCVYWLNSAARGRKGRSSDEDPIERQADLRELQDRPPPGQGLRDLRQPPPQATPRLSPDPPSPAAPTSNSNPGACPPSHAFASRRLGRMPRILGVDIPNDKRTVIS